MNPLYQTLHEYRWRKRGHRWHRYSAARAITTLRFTHIFLTRQKEILHMNVTGTFTAPVNRKDGTALALDEIDHFSLTRNGSEIQKLAPSDAVINWTDNTPLTGADDYEVFTITKDGFTSDPSNDAVVTVTEANPAAAVNDLKATFNP